MACVHLQVLYCPGPGASLPTMPFRLEVPNLTPPAVGLADTTWRPREVVELYCPGPGTPAPAPSAEEDVEVPKEKAGAFGFNDDADLARAPMRCASPSR